MPRPTRKRYGNDGGGLPLGQILALALGGGEANPDFEAAQAAQASGQVGPLTAGQDKALKTGPYKPNNVFQKFYGMDAGNEANMRYQTGRALAEDSLQREIGAIPKRADAETQAKIKSSKDLQRAEAERLAPSIPAMAGKGQLPDTGVPTTDPIAYVEDILRRYGPNGLNSILRQGESDLLAATTDRAKMPRAGEEAQAGQAANISKSKLETTAADQERSTREKFPQEVEKGTRGEFLRPAYQQVGGVMFDITDPRYQFTATPEQRGGVDPMTGQMTSSKPPGFIIATPEGVSGPGVVGKAAPPAGAPASSPAGAAKTSAKPAERTDQVGGPVNALVPSLSYPVQRSPEQIALEREAAAQVLEQLKQKIANSPYVRGY